MSAYSKGPGYGEYRINDAPVSGGKAVPRTPAGDCRGLTLIEILVTAFLLSLILGAAYSFAGSTMLNWKKGDEQVDVQQNLRLAMDRLTRELRISAGLVEISDNLYIIFMNPDAMNPGKYIKYYFAGNEIRRATSSDKTGWYGNNPVAGKIQAVSFQRVAGRPATVEIKLTGTNGFVLTSRVTVRMMREQY